MGMYGELLCVKDIPGYHQLWNTRSANGLCPTMNYPAYCNVVTDAAFQCNTYFLSPTVRAYMRPCYDVLVLWLMDCPVYASVGTIEMVEAYDSAIYLAQETVAQSMAHVAFTISGPDWVCLPYTYYFPETTDGTTDGETDVIDGDLEESVA